VDAKGLADKVATNEQNSVCSKRHGTYIRKYSFMFNNRLSELKVLANKLGQDDKRVPWAALNYPGHKIE
jgi:hypothetical protein